MDHACRIGGDEFAVIAFAPPSIAMSMAQRVLAAMDGQVSIGLAPLWPGDEVADLVERADAALYEAKDNGRGQAVLAPVEEPLAEATGGA